MARTIRKNNPKLIQSIHRNRALETHGLFNWQTRKDSKILRGQDGAIRYDKCLTAHVDNEGGMTLDSNDTIVSKGGVKEVARKTRRAGKILIDRQLNA